MSNWYKLDSVDVLQHLGTDGAQGLSQAQCWGAFAVEPAYCNTSTTNAIDAINRY